MVSPVSLSKSWTYAEQASQSALHLLPAIPTAPSTLKLARYADDVPSGTRPRTVRAQTAVPSVEEILATYACCAAPLESLVINTFSPNVMFPAKKPQMARYPSAYVKSSGYV